MRRPRRAQRTATAAVGCRSLQLAGCQRATPPSSTQRPGPTSPELHGGARSASSPQQLPSPPTPAPLLPPLSGVGDAVDRCVAHWALLRGEGCWSPSPRSQTSYLGAGGEDAGEHHSSSSGTPRITIRPATSLWPITSTTVLGSRAPEAGDGGGAGGRGGRSGHDAGRQGAAACANRGRVDPDPRPSAGTADRCGRQPSAGPPFPGTPTPTGNEIIAVPGGSQWLAAAAGARARRAAGRCHPRNYRYLVHQGPGEAVRAPRPP